MKKKPKLEADLDPVGTRHTRPGAAAAQRAVENTKRRTAARKTIREPSRPGATAAARAVEATKAKKRK
jgi:hypothetical protein